MKITVEISDEFIYEDRLTDAIKRSIICDVTNAVKALVKEQVEKEIQDVAIRSIKELVAETTQKVISDFAETGTILISGKEVNVHEHLKHVFQTNSGWNNPAEQVRQLAEKWSKELKAKYDGAFVTQLVQRINLAGMLKPEVEKLLLSDTKQD